MLPARRDSEGRYDPRHPLFDGHLTRKDLARLLHVRAERIRQWERRGLIPRLAPPGTRMVLYPRSAVLAWLARIEANETSRQTGTAKSGRSEP